MPTDNNNPNRQVKIDFLFKVIERFDFYINSTNAKASAIMAWNGILIVIAFMKFEALMGAFETNDWSVGLAAFLVLGVVSCCAISLYYVFRVINPFVKHPESMASADSYIFFRAVADLSPQVYSEKIDGLMREDILTDLINQSHAMARILNIKMANVTRSLVAVFIGVVFILLAIVLKAVLIYFSL
ncbi:MAG TPA: DUF5706 domain-containing protein [Elusimicrobiota bacterium]|nr:DUF5706 domain-containing protein [Elusimicrobiota bacterium]